MILIAIRGLNIQGKERFCFVHCDKSQVDGVDVWADIPASSHGDKKGLGTWVMALVVIL